MPFLFRTAVWVDFFDGWRHVFRVHFLTPFKTMSNFYYTDENGQRGLINAEQLKALAVQGAITPDTLLETETGQKGTAGQIKGLFASVPMPPIADPGVVDTSDEDEYDYRSIASAHRLLVVSVGIRILAGAIPIYCLAVSDGNDAMIALFGITIILSWGAAFFTAVCTARLAQSLRYEISAIAVLAILSFLPYLVLIPLLIVLLDAMKNLKRAGYKVGFLGANMRQFDDDDDD